MKVKVLKNFVDKYTKTLHETGQKIEVTKERYKEINSTSLSTFVEEIVEEGIKGNVGTNPPTTKKSPGIPNKKKSTSK